MNAEIDWSSIRVGSDHEEQVVGDRSICGTCGWIDEADPGSPIIQKWHGDSFEDDASAAGQD